MNKLINYIKRKPFSTVLLAILIPLVAFHIFIIVYLFFIEVGLKDTLILIGSVSLFVFIVTKAIKEY